MPTSSFVHLSAGETRGVGVKVFEYILHVFSTFQTDLDYMKKTKDVPYTTTPRHLPALLLKWCVLLSNGC